MKEGREGGKAKKKKKKEKERTKSNKMHLTEHIYVQPQLNISRNPPRNCVKRTSELSCTVEGFPNTDRPTLGSDTQAKF